MLNSKVYMGLVFILLFGILFISLSNGANLYYSTFIGGSSGDHGNAIALDSAGNAYVTGVTDSNDFPLVIGAYDTVNHGNGDIFVVKLNPTGNSLIYSTLIGGSNYDNARGIAVDKNGSAYITGGTASPDFPTIPGSFDTVYHTSALEIFITKLDPTGSMLTYSGLLGGSSGGFVAPGVDEGYAIAVDSVGNAYVTGFTSSFEFRVTINGYLRSYVNIGAYDAFLTKVNSSGSTLNYSSYFGGGGTDYGYDIKVDDDGLVYITGFTYSGLPTSVGAYDSIHDGSIEGYISVFNPSLFRSASLLYSTYFGKSGFTQNYGLALDTQKNVYIAGYTDSSSGITITLGAYDSTFNGTEYNSFVAKFNPALSQLLYSTFLGEAVFVNTMSGNIKLAVDNSGCAFITGQAGENFPITPGALDTTWNDFIKSFVSKFNSDGSILQYSTYLGGTTGGWGRGIALDQNGLCYLTGYAYSDDFPVTSNSFDTSFNGATDTYITKMELIPLVPIELSEFQVSSLELIEEEKYYSDSLYP